MRKKRIEILLIVVAALAMSAGVVAGLLASRLPSAAGQQPAATNPVQTAPPAAFERTLADELQLRPAQREQMREIWEGVRGTVHDTFTDAQNLQKERDEALVALLNDEQRVKFAKISKDYADRFEALTKKRDRTFEEAVEKTKQILDEPQREKYDEILKTHVRRGPPAGLPPPPGPPPDAPKP